MNGYFKHVAMAGCAAMLLACAGDGKPVAGAVAVPAVATNVAEDQSPLPAGAETPMFWTVAQWKTWDTPSK